MKILVTIPLILIFLLGQVSGAAEQCRFYFGQPITTESSRVELLKIGETNLRSKIKIETQTLVENTNEAALDLMRLLVDGPSFILDEKIALLKDTMELSIPLKNGYWLLVSYDSRSMSGSRFVLDKIFLLSEATKTKIADNMLLPPNTFTFDAATPVEKLTLAKTDFELPEYFPKDYLLKLKIPLVVDGPSLEKLAQFAKYFDYFTKKDDLRKIINQKSPFKRKLLLQVGKAKSILTSVVLKQPFKIVVQGIMLGIAINGASYMMTNYNVNLNPFQAFSHQPSIVEKSTSFTQFASQSPEVKSQFKAVVEEAQQRLALNEPYTGPKISKTLMDSSNKFSINANTWIFEKNDPSENVKRTYIVFSEESTNKNIDNIQYFILEIDATKYAALIQAIKAQLIIK